MEWFRDKTARAVVSGPTGSGKSYFLKLHVPQEPRVLCMDALEEYEVPYFRDLREADEWFQARRPDRFRIGLRVPQEEIDRCLRYAWALKPVLIVVEEADLSAPNGRDLAPGMQYLTNYGRRFKMGVWFVTRRPTNLSHAITANCRYLVLFPTPEPGDQDYWNAFIPAPLQGKTWDFLDRSDRAGNCAVVDTRSRTVQLIAPDGRGATSHGVHQEPARDRARGGDRGEDREPADPDDHQAELDPLPEAQPEPPPAPNNEV